MQRRSDCPISFTLDHVGDKWTLLILRDMVFSGKSRFGEFLASEEGMATNILSERLERLTASGILRREPGEGKSRTRYSLTAKGLDFIPILADMVAWGARHDACTGVPRGLVEAIARNRKAVVKNLRKSRSKK